MTLRIYNDEGYAYSVSAYHDKQSGIRTLNIADRKNENSLRYFDEPMLVYLNGYSYRPFERWNSSSFTVYYSGDIGLSEMEYWAVESADDRSVIGKVFADEEETDPSYTFTLTLEGVDSVYYRHVTAEEVANADITVKAIKNNTVTVKNSVTKDMLNALDAVGGPGDPTLTVTGYAVQYAGNPTAAEAWGRVTDPTTPETP